MAGVLSLGMQGEDVKKLQAVLNYHRLSPTEDILVVDGHFGQNTKARVQAFQQLNMLSADGIVGPNTAAALMTICHFSAEYVATRNEVEFLVGGNGGTTVTKHYELKDGLKLTLDPWTAPPAKLQYVLEYEASFVVKNPRMPLPFTLEIGAEIGAMPLSVSLDAPYQFTGAGRVLGKFTKDFTLGPIKLDAGIQAGFELEHEADSHPVEFTSQLSLATGVSFTIVKNRFYLFTQGELGAAVKWFPGTVQGSVEWEGTAGFRLTF